MADQTIVTRTQAMFNLGMNNPQRFESATLLENADLGRQQGMTNELLEMNLRVAYENSKAMQGIHERMRELRENTERERHLKELLYQMSKLLKADQGSVVDPIEMALRSRIFLNTLGEFGLTTMDLTELSEKRLFDNLVSRANACVTESVCKQLEDFETTYGFYGVAKAHDAGQGVPPLALLAPSPPAEVSLPKPPVLVEPSDKPEDTFEKEITNWFQNGATWTVICVVVLLVRMFWSSPMTSFFGICAVIGLIPGIYQLVKARLTTADPLRYSQEQREWEQRKAKWDKNMQKANEKHALGMVAYQDEVKTAEGAAEDAGRAFRTAMAEYEKQVVKQAEEIQNLRQSHQRTLDHMASNINEFLDAHPGLQEFLPKVLRVKVDAADRAGDGVSKAVTEDSTPVGVVPEKVPCVVCGDAILQSTSKRNKGKCGICIKKVTEDKK